MRAISGGSLLLAASLILVPLAGEGRADGPVAAAALPHAVKVARTRTIPACTRYVDVSFTGVPNGTVARPFKSIKAAVNAAPAGAIICVAQGVYREQIAPGAKYFTLAGGFQRGKAFKVRDSALYVTRAQGNGAGSFIRIQDPAPTGSQLTAIDGFEITGYAQAIVRAFFISQRFNITNNFIHDNDCKDPALAGAAFSIDNISGVIRGNVIRKNRCGRGGGGFLYDGLNENSIVLDRNFVDQNAGTEPGISHGGGFYLFGHRLTVRGNLFSGNTVTGWGAGLYVGAFPAGGPATAAAISWNIYRNNRAGIAGGGFFCDDSAVCSSDHDLFDRNCGGNAYLDSGETKPTILRFNHMTNVNARAVGCSGAGVGLQIDHANTSSDTATVVNSIFFGNQAGADLAASCGAGCGTVKITVTYSMVQKKYLNNGGVNVTFGSGILAPVDPRFVDPAAGDFHLKSKSGHFTPTGRVNDAVSSPLLAKADPAGASTLDPACAGARSELGTYGNSPEASCVP